MWLDALVSNLSNGDLLGEGQGGPLMRSIEDYWEVCHCVRSCRQGENLGDC